MDLARKLSDLVGADAVLTAPADLDPYLIDEVQLRFELDPAQTRVFSRLLVRQNP